MEVDIPKPNKDINKGTSYRPISLLSVIAKTLENILLPYITTNIPNTSMQHRYKTQHYTVTTLHTLNNHCSTRYEQSFRHNKHTHKSESCYRSRFLAQSLCCCCLPMAHARERVRSLRLWFTSQLICPQIQG